MATTTTSTEPQPPDPLTRTMDKVKQSCDRFRVLVLGREGVGKSSLINHIFKVEIAEVSEYTSGAADINKEIFSAENDSLVLHDSRGYGAGELKNFQKLEEFINDRIGNANMGDRLHAIWLCIATPVAGGRIRETGDEKIFRVVRGKVPIIVVFTQYDRLVMKKEYELRESEIPKTEDEIQSLAKLKAQESFVEDCVSPMTKVDGRVPCLCVSVEPDFEETLQNLVKTTLHCINPREYPLASTSLSGPSKSPSKFRSFFSFKFSKKAETIEPINPVSVMLATAQRVVLDPKITESISVGRTKYWKGLASGANFLGRDLRQCLAVIHDDIVEIWNFPSLPMLFDESFRGKVTELVAELADPQGPSPSDHIIQNTTNVAGAATAIAVIVAGAANPVGFIVGPIVGAAVFAKWVYDVYKATHGVLRCFMAYIVDLIIIMQMIFIISQGRADGVVTREEVEGVLKDFEANRRSNVHRDIRKFVREEGVLKGRDIVLEKMVELIGQSLTPLEGQ